MFVHTCACIRSMCTCVYVSRVRGQQVDTIRLLICSVVVHSPWDIRSCLYPQCVLTSVTLPSYARDWIDMRKLFSKLYRLPKFNIEKMLEHLGLKFVGQPHSGIDDAKNICRIVSQMIQDGCSLTVNCTCDTPVAPHQPHD